MPTFPLSFVYALLAWHAATALAAGDQPEPRRLLREAAAAMRSANTVTYDATYVGIGEAANWPSYAAHVSLKRLRNSGGVPGRLAIHGTGRYPGESAERKFATTFDGRSVQWIRRSQQAVVERTFPPDGPLDRDWGNITAHFGRAGSSVILFDFLSESPLKRALAAETIEYQGSISIEGRLCHIVLTEQTARSSQGKRSARWFLDAEDKLPRRLERLWTRDGRIAGEILTLSNLSNNEMTDDEFRIATPAGYTIVSYVPSQAQPVIPVTVGSQAPAWKLPDTDGNQRSSNEFRGRFVVLDFWAEWCAPCKLAMPALQKIHERFADRGVAVIGASFSTRPGEKNPADYVKRMGYTYPQLLDANETAVRFGVRALPSLFLISPTGEILLSRTGYDAEFETEVTEMIRKHAPPAP